jgi:hypothetical protein
MLLSARPVYETGGSRPRTAADWCAAIAAILGAPVLLRSAGPRTTDKTAATTLGSPTR